jgi:hypothetical protein
MKYAYIQIGDQVFFQAQNIYSGYGKTIVESEGLTIQSVSYPAYEGRDLFVNGSEADQNFRLVEIPIERFTQCEVKQCVNF